MLNGSRLARVAGAPRWVIIVSFAVLLSLSGALGLVRATKARLDEVARVPGMGAVLSPATAGVENVLIVGSDSRAGADPDDPDYANVGSESDTPGMRSDSMIVARIDGATGRVALMSIPRDLWVRIGDSEKYNRINAAYQEGPATLVRTVQRALNIPVHHYVEIGFPGFRRIVDSIGGVRICVQRPSRDLSTGYFSGRGCKRLNGAKALAYARGRHFEEKRNGRWVEEGTGDVGRGARQRAFMAALVKDAAAHLVAHPMDTERVLSAFAAAVTVDERIDLVDLARKLRPLGNGGGDSYSLPVVSDMLDGKFVFHLDNDAQALLAHFSGLAPAPAAG